MSSSVSTESATPDLRFTQFTGFWTESKIGKHTLSSAFGPRFSSTLYSSSGNIATLRTTDMDDNGVICFDHLPLADLDEKAFADHILQAGDLVISRSGTIGVTGIFYGHVVPVVPGAFLIRFRLDQESVCSPFVQHYLNSEKGRKKLNNLAAGGVQKNLKGSSVLEMGAHFPTLPEQRKIADFLTAVDGRIGQLIQKKALLEDYKKGVMQQLFTQALRFKDDHGNDFPEWEEKKLGEAVDEIKSGLSLDQNGNGVGFKVTRIETISDRTINLDKVGYVETDKNIKDFRLLPGDILFSNINSVAHIGKVAFVDRDYDLYQGMNLLRIRCDSKCDPSFLFQMLKSAPLVRYFQRICNQAVSQASINQTDLKKTPLKLPTLPEQTKIANFLTALDRKIESVAQQITHTQTFKQGLLQQMFV